MNDSVISQAAAITGPANVLKPGDSRFQELIQRLPPVLGTRPDFRLVASPAAPTEVAALVRLARQENLGLYTRYSASAVGSRLRGDGACLVLDLNRMNRVLAVDAKYAYARVEPGVTYLDLARHLDREGTGLLVDSERDPRASVVGSFLSKGVGHTPYADHALMQCGAEFVLPDGVLLRTGMGAMADNRAWPLYKFALGPYPDGLALQSDIAIPTQMGIWLMGRPPAFQPFALELSDDAALGGILEMLRPLKINNTLGGTITITHRDLARARRSPASGGAPWRLSGALYGIPEVVALTAPVLTAGFRSVAGARVVPEAELGADPGWQEQVALMAGKPGFSTPDPGAACLAKLVFAAPQEAPTAIKMQDTVQRVAAALGMPALMEFQLVGRALLLSVYLSYRATDTGAPQLLARMASSLLAQMSQAGFGVCSESVEFSRLAADHAGQGGLGRLQARLGTALAS